MSQSKHTLHRDSTVAHHNALAVLHDIDCGRTSLISKILFQLGEMMKMSRHQVKHNLLQQHFYHFETGLRMFNSLYAN